AFRPRSGGTGDGVDRAPLVDDVLGLGGDLPSHHGPLRHRHAATELGGAGEPAALDRLWRARPAGARPAAARRLLALDRRGAAADGGPRRGADRGRGGDVVLDLPLSRPRRGGDGRHPASSGGRAGGDPSHEPRRDPFLLDPASDRQARQHPGPGQCPAAAGGRGGGRGGRDRGHLRRILRHRPCRDAVRGAGPSRGQDGSRHRRDTPRGSAAHADRAARTRRPAGGAAAMTREKDAGAPPEARDPIRLHKALTRIWGAGPGLARLSATNHSVLGMRFMITAGVFFLMAGIPAMIIRAKLSTPPSAFLGAETYSQIFALHGTVMMFLFAIPMLEGLAGYMLPKLMGARDLAFPRLTAFGYWCYLFDGSIIVLSLLFGVAPDSGWFMYVPLSSKPHSPGVNSDVWLLGITFVEISALTFATTLVVSILKIRAPGMTLGRMPIFAWYMLVTSLMIILGFPPLILGSILLEAERAFGLPFFDPTRGGSARS